MKISLRRAAAAAIAVIMVVAASLSFASEFDGPLQVKNQFPVFLPIDQPYLEQAREESSFSASLSHSSTFIMEDTPQWSAHMDLEMTELNLRFKKEVPGLFELGADVPFLRVTSGFMDSPLSWYHRTFGFPDYGRSTRPNNSLLYDIRKNGRPVIEGANDQAGIGDTRLTVKRQLTDLDPVISLMADVELPTGDADIGYGSGSFDYGAAVLVDKDLWSWGRLYANAGAVFPGPLKAYQTVNLQNFAYAGTGAEARFFPRLSLIAQLLVQTSPYPQTGIFQIDDVGMILVMGGRYYRENGNYEFSLTEDPNVTGAPDFILNVSYKHRF